MLPCIPGRLPLFIKNLFDKLKALDIDVKIYARPNEIDPAIPFEEDEVHQSYDKDQINLFWKALVKNRTRF